MQTLASSQSKPARKREEISLQMALKGPNVEAQSATLGRSKPVDCQALKERDNNSRWSMSPFQGLRFPSNNSPGLRPGLSNHALSGLRHSEHLSRAPALA